MSELLRLYIRSLLTEAPIDAWMKRNRTSTEEEAKKISLYFSDLTGRYSARLDNSAKDLVPLTFGQVQLLHRAVQESETSNLKSKPAQWLTRQIKSAWDLGEDLTIEQLKEDYIPLLRIYQNNSKKFDPEFLNRVSTIEDLNREIDEKIGSAQVSADLSGGQLGFIAEKGEWSLYAAPNTQASCELGKTGGKRDTTWCTTRDDSENLFNQYTSSPHADVILFYLIKKGVSTSADPLAKMSVGFKNGKPDFSGTSGGLTVDSKNKGITRKIYNSALGPDAGYFLDIMKGKAAETGGKHPNKIEMENLLGDVSLFSKKFESLGSDKEGERQRSDLVDQALQWMKNLKSYDVFKYLIDRGETPISLKIAKFYSTPAEILEYMSTKKPDLEVFRVIAKRNGANLGTLRRLMRTFPDDPVLLKSIADNDNANQDLIRDILEISPDMGPGMLHNQNIPSSLLAKMATDEAYSHVLIHIAGHRNTPPETIALLARNEEPHIRAQVAGRKNAGEETLRRLADDDKSFIRSAVAANPKTPQDALEKLSEDPDDGVRWSVSTNESLPTETLYKMLDNLSLDAIRDHAGYTKDTAIIEKIFSAFFEGKIIEPRSPLSAIGYVIYNNSITPQWIKDSKQIQDSIKSFKKNEVVTRRRSSAAHLERSDVMLQERVIRRILSALRGN